MGQPDSLTQGLAAFLQGAGGQILKGKDEQDKESLWNRNRQAQVQDREALMKQQQDFQGQNLAANRYDRDFTRADGIFDTLTKRLGIEQEKDPKKRELIYQQAESEMKSHYPKDYQFYATEVMKGKKPLSTIATPAQKPGEGGGLMNSLSRLALGQKSNSLPVDSLSTAFPRASAQVGSDLNNIKDYGIPGAMMAGSPAGGLQKLLSVGSDVANGGAEMIGNAMGIGTPKPMHPMGQQPMPPMPSPMMPQTPTPTMDSIAPKLMRPQKVKLRKRL